MHNALVSISVAGTADCLWSYTVKASGHVLRVAPPVFEIAGREVAAVLTDIAPLGLPQCLPNGVMEQAFAGRFAADPDLMLELVFRLAPDNPVVRFRYRLGSTRGTTLTKAGGRDTLRYLGLSLEALPHCKEVRFSEFDESVHSFRLTENPVLDSAFEDAQAAMGPLLCAGDAHHRLLVAYEHGSQVPDAFVQYRFLPSRRVELTAVKGNYWTGQAVSAAAPFETLWLQLAAVAGSEADLAAAYRDFVLRYQTQNLASRKPYIFYNTWCYQERNKWRNGAKYLDSMNLQRILDEIDVAHRMGIDVFVLDTGWYRKAGDWRVNTEFFPDGLAQVRRKLDGYGMKLGLWFSPTQAAVSSRMMQEMPECRMRWDDTFHGPYEVWETEACYSFCLASRYWEAFADELIRLVQEVGVTYFKWDAVGQYGCNSAEHWHGTAANSAGERADCYAFEQVRYMTRIVDRLCAACPEAIVDFDVTEGGRTVGLGFLSAGKYFLINNGPYFPNLDIPFDWATATTWSNVYVHPGPARARVCRTPLDFDKWLPSVLYLTHYLPDDPADSQLINIASLILGQNGIWGDLPAISADGVARFGELLSRYKQVRDDITAAAPARFGIVGGSPEVHEKINPRTGRGVVCVFAAAAGTYTYVTRQAVAAADWHTEGVAVSRDAAGRAVLECRFAKPGAQLCFLGVSA